MILQNPFVDFDATKKNFDKFIELYNTSKLLGQRLRSHHVELFYDLVRLYRRNISQRKQRFIGATPELYSIDTRDIPNLLTNNKELAHRRHCDPSTIYRQINRLFQAKVILDKVNHGSRKNYELMLNPALIAIMDLNSKNALMPDAELAFFSDRNAICNPNTVSKIETVNNIIIPKIGRFYFINKLETSLNGNNDKELLRNNIPFDRLETISNRNTAKKSKMESSPATKNHDKEEDRLKDYAKKVESVDEKLRKVRRNFASWLVSLMVDNLLEGRSVYPGELNRTVDYVTETYFGHLQSFTAIDKQMFKYRKLIELAKNYKNSHPQYQSPFPFRYFDINNTTNGFVSTRKWLKKQKEYQRIKKYRKTQSDQLKLLKAINDFNDDGSVKNYEKQRAYVKTNIPHLLQVFDKMVRESAELKRKVASV